VLLACASCYALKAAGYLLPSRLVQDQRVAGVAGLVTVGLLASLVAVQTLAQGPALALDARVASLVVAAVALALRAPFVVVVALGALTAAGLRAVA
jgi:uncharacterized membrane protein